MCVEKQERKFEEFRAVLWFLGMEKVYWERMDPSFRAFPQRGKWELPTPGRYTKATTSETIGDY